jgi:hypothetical protein
MQNTTFATLMTQLFDESDFKTMREFHSAMVSSGTPVNYTTLMSYKKFDVVPSFEKAKAIIQEFNYQISDEDLRKVLLYSQQELRRIKQSRKYIQRGIRLNPRHFGSDMNPEKLERRMQERAEELFGDKATLNMYLEFLIKNDLNEIEKANHAN